MFTHLHCSPLSSYLGIYYCVLVVIICFERALLKSPPEFLTVGSAYLMQKLYGHKSHPDEERCSIVGRRLPWKQEARLKQVERRAEGIVHARAAAASQSYRVALPRPLLGWCPVIENGCSPRIA
jgi:hypothetical protein